MLAEHELNLTFCSNVFTEKNANKLGFVCQTPHLRPYKGSTCSRARRLGESAVVNMI